MKCKLRRIGNSVGVILPSSVITSYNIGDEIVITIGDVITHDTLRQPSPQEVIESVPCGTKPEPSKARLPHIKRGVVHEVPPRRVIKPQSYNPMMVGYVPPQSTGATKQ